MRNKIILFALLSIAIISCQKEIDKDSYGPINNGGGSGGGGTTGGNASLLGTWNFAGLEANTSTDITSDLFGTIMRTVTVASYNTKQNTGTYTFTASEFKGNNVGYSVDTVIKAYTYIDGVFEDSLESPFQMPLMVSSSTSTYKLVGTDSIYFNSGSITVSGGTPGVAAEPQGAKFKIVGNTLTMTFNMSRDTTMLESGMTMTVKQRLLGSIKLTK